MKFKNLKKHKIFIATFFILFFYNIVVGQGIGKIFNRYYPPKEYNGSLQNWTIVSDNNGLMYFGNHDGVLEYDGSTWRKIEILNKSTVRSLTITSKGKILVGAIGEMGYLAPNNIGTLQFVSIKPYLDSSYYSFADIWSTQSTKDGDYYLSDDYLFRFQDNKFKIWKKHAAYFYLCFVIYDDLYLYEVGVGLQKIINDSLVLLPKGDFFSDKRIHAIIPFENKLFVFTRNNGVYIYNPQDFENPIIAYSDISNKTKQINEFLIKNTVYSATSISKDIYAVATLNAGAFIFNSSGNILDIINNETTNTSSHVYTMSYQPNGNLWLGLDNGIQKVEIGSPFRYWDKSQGISGSVYSLIVLNKNLYIATVAGLFKLDLQEKNNIFDVNNVENIKGINEQTYSLLLFNPQNIKNTDVISNKNSLLIKKLKLKDTTLLIGTSRGIYALVNNKIELISNYKGTYCLYQSVQNPSLIYFGSDSGIGCISYDNGNWFYRGNIGKIADQIKSISEDDKGNLWAVANYKGIYKIPKDILIQNDENLNTGNKIEFYNKNCGIENITDILISKINNQLKFFSIDSFYVFNEKIKKFQIDTSVNEKYIDSTWYEQILVNSKKNMWFNTQLQNKEENNNKNYSDTITFKRLTDFLIGVVYKNNNSKLWIGYPEGFICYEKKYEKKYFDNYKTIIRSVYLNNDSLIFNGTNIIKTKQKYFAEEYAANFDNIINLNTIITHSYNSISFSFSALSFDDESKNQYSYLLSGYDKNWSQWNNETKKEYTNLREGNYVFKVKARNIYGIQSTIAEFKFSILPPWYRTIIAYIVYFILSVIFIILILKLYTIKLRNEKVRLEKIVKDRTQEIFNQKEEIQTQAENLKVANDRILAKNSELEYQKEEITKQAKQLRKANIDLIKLSKVASETDNAITIFDKDGNIEWINDGFTRMYGYTLEQFKTERSANLIEGSENPNISEVVKICISEKKSMVYEFKTNTREGKEIWAQTTLTHIVNKDKATLNLIAIDSDITMLKKAEEEITKQKLKIEKQRDLLEISNATKNKFFRIIAHDLRNPISTLVSSTNIILEDIKYYNKEKTTKFIGELNKLSQTTYILLENLLDWSTSQMGEIPFNPKKVDITLIIKENIELVIAKANSKNIRLEVSFPIHAYVYADEDMVKAIIRNLLSNAMKFTLENGLINISVIEDEKYIITDISDTGIGISENDLNKLFRTDIHHSTPGTSNEKGSGLGLILCKEFIEKNEGIITVSSEIGKGSTFSIKLKKA